MHDDKQSAAIAANNAEVPFMMRGAYFSIGATYMCSHECAVSHMTCAFSALLSRRYVQIAVCGVSPHCDLSAFQAGY